MEACPLCKLQLTRHVPRPEGKDGILYECKNCATFFIARSVKGKIDALDEINKAKISFQTARVGLPERPYELHSINVEAIVRQEQLPTPTEQTELLVLHFGNDLRALGNHLDEFNMAHNSAKFGAINGYGLLRVIQYLENTGLITGQHINGPQGGVYSHVELTIDGWAEYRRLRRGNTQSKYGFMAMSFHNQDVSRAFESCFRKAAKRAGYILRLVSEEPEHGLIDDQIRVRIATSKFVIADLTEANNGAYWEAGYAEGMEKPVFYTCNQQYYQQQKDIGHDGVHFDTNHQVITFWSLSDLKSAEDQLTAMIRRAFPHDAVMEDEVEI
ncbi:MAG: hypothetical protein IT367_09575 [Candidatus Hydrogenedentes bacterium]|nr:hypothetical protein [Candidatus Hydrogenedentota bacterium]